MEGGERKEEASLPPDYVSLAQLHERWLQKKLEEVKRKEEEEERREREREARELRRKQEEDERSEREREARELRRKQEEDERREREARAERERNRNQNRNQGAKIGGLVEEKGNGKEVVRGGDCNGGGNSRKNGGNWGRKRGRNFRGAAAVVAEIGEGGSGGGLSGVEEVGTVCVVEILPRNGEIGDVERSDFKKNGRNEVSTRVNELKQSEEAIEFGKEEGDEKDCGQKWRGSVSGSGRGEIKGERGRGIHRKGERGRWGDRGRNGGDQERRINMLQEYRPVVVEGNGVDSKLEDEAGDEISGVRGEGNRLRVGDRNEMRGRYSKAKEDGAKGQGSNGEGKKVDHKAIARKGEKSGSGRGYQAIGIRGYDNKTKEEGVEVEGSNGEIVEIELEQKVAHKVLPRKGENRGFRRTYRTNGIQWGDNEAKEGGVEGEGENGEKVEVELEKKFDPKSLPRKGENRGFGKAYRGNGIRGKDNEAKEEGVEGEGSKGEKVEVEFEKKVGHKSVPRKGENRGFGKAYRGNGIRGNDNEAKEERVEGEGSNGEKVEVELEKKVNHKSLPRNGQNRGFGKAYRGKGIWGQDNEAKEERVEGEGSNGELLEVEFEKKVDTGSLPRKGEHRGFGKAYRGTGIRGKDNKAKEEGVEGEGSNGEFVRVELDKKVDQKILPRRGQYRDYERNRANGIQGGDNKATEEGVVGECSNGDTVEVEPEKKVEHKVLPRKGEYMGFGRTHQANGIHGGDNKAADGEFEGEISNGDKKAVVIVKAVYPKVLPRNGQKGRFGRGYPGNGIRRGDFGRGYLDSGNRGVRFGSSGKLVWVKKEDLDA